MGGICPTYTDGRYGTDRKQPAYRKSTYWTKVRTLKQNQWNTIKKIINNTCDEKNNNK
jgi:hypothetical protein